MNEKGERNNLLDLMKGIACIMVVCMHFPTKRFGTGFYSLESGLGRCGVPLFLMISGYLAGQKILYGKKTVDAGKWFLRQFRKIVTYFVVFSVVVYFIYAAFDLLTGAESPSVTVTWNIRNIFLLLIAGKPLVFGYMWYLTAYAGCLLVFFLLSKLGAAGYRLAWICTPVLLILYHVLGRYSLVILHRDLPYYYASNYLMAAVPMFCLGFYLPKLRPAARSRSNMMILIAASVFCLLCEFRAFTAQPAFDPERNNYFFNLVTAFLLMQLITAHAWQVSGDHFLVQIGRKYSLYIYIFQFLASKLCNTFVNFLGRFPSAKVFVVMYRFGRPFVVFMVSLTIAAAVYHTEQTLKNRINSEPGSP